MVLGCLLGLSHDRPILGSTSALMLEASKLERELKCLAPNDTPDITGFLECEGRRIT